ncbi:hypothetical protein FACS189432_01760 [Bacteroidia bacterium]|nr:hypothetical protein FACS189432_01760 [Bacteroidia bacterium]
MVVCLSAFAFAYGFEGNDDNVTRDYYVQLYTSQPYIPDFKMVFQTESDKADYKKLREYLNNKEEILRIIRMAGDEYYYGLSYSKLYAIDYIQSLEEDLKMRDPNERMLLRLNSVRPNFDYNGEFSVGYIELEIMPTIKARFAEAASRDSLNQITYMQIQRNVSAIQLDVFQAEQAIYASLSPEFRNQDFRIWISLTFSGLIAVLLLAFFFIIFKRSDANLSQLLLSGAGLQFITVFILIIAIILFGILNVLGGSELAAILSGISGYVLGKGGEVIADKMKTKENTVPPVQENPNKDTVGDEPETYLQPEEERRQPEIAEEKQPEETEEEEKFFPGGSY